MRIVTALGGNALLRRGEPLTADNQRENVRIACAQLARIIPGNEVVIAHGNGPQVGLLALQSAAYSDVPPYPLDVLGAQTEGMIGYMIEQELGNLLPVEVPFATILTQVEVDASDPAFRIRASPSGRSTRRWRPSAWPRRRAGHRPRWGRFPPRGPEPAPQAHLRDPSREVAARERERGDLCGRWRHTDRLR